MAITFEAAILDVNETLSDFPLHAARRLLAGVETLDRAPGEAAEHLLAGIADLPVHAEVPEGVRALAGAGIRLATLTVGSAEQSARLLERAGVGDAFERYLSAAEVRRWKPAVEPYLHAAGELGVPPERCLLIAVHPWDVDGARRAGMRAAWLNREGGDYPEFFEDPDLVADGLPALARMVSAST